MRGRVINFPHSKAYGFIRPHGDQQVDDVFFHIDEAEYEAPRPGDIVEFEEGPPGKDRHIRALAVRLIERRSLRE